MNRIYLNDGWYFTKHFTEDIVKRDADLSRMEQVRIPHTVCETPMNYFDEKCCQLVSGYRREIEVEDEWRDGHILLTFEGAAHEAVVYVNGIKALRHRSGYTAFTVDLVPYLTEGREQVIAVRLDSRESLNQPPFGGVIDYLTYGGIYRDVYLEVKDQYYIEDIYTVTPDVMREDMVLKADITLNHWTRGLSFEACLDLWEEVPDQPWHQELAGTDAGFRISCLTWYVKDAYTWDIDMPVLYILTVRLKKDGKVIDTRQVRFGFREIGFESDGFYLNGRQVKLRGLNRHQSWPYVGYAMPKTPQQLDADILKFDLGCNIVRTSHYPQSQYFLDRCDEVGLLVFTEIPGWQHIGDTLWKKIAVRNVREMITQYRNHPSIIMWGVRINESQDDDPFYYKTNLTAHELDLYRPTAGVRYLKHSRLFEDVYTYNDFVCTGDNEGCLPRAKVTDRTDRPYFISEYNGHMFPTKMWDDEDHRKEHALRHARVLNAIAGETDIIGSTGWCMFDYNTHGDFGSGDKICYHGVMDYFRNPKPAAAVYKSQSEFEPVMEVAASMNIGEHPAGIIGDVAVFTNLDSVRVYRNGDFIGEYFPDEQTYGEMDHPPVLITGLDKYTEKWGGKAGSWRFAGTKDGREVLTAIREPVDRCLLRITADRQTLVEEHSYDAATIHIEAIDKNETHLYYYQEPVTLRTEGCIEVIGPKVVSLRGGFAGTYVKSLGRSGKGTLYVSDAAGEVKIDFEVKA